jgi:hypothetical protein
MEDSTVSPQYSFCLFFVMLNLPDNPAIPGCRSRITLLRENLRNQHMNAHSVTAKDSSLPSGTACAAFIS